MKPSVSPALINLTNSDKCHLSQRWLKTTSSKMNKMCSSSLHSKTNCLTHRVHPKSLNSVHVSLTCLFSLHLSPSHWGCLERRMREIRCLFLWSVTWSDVRFWWRRQLITVGVVTVVSAEQQCFLSAACYLFNKHLHMKNNLQSVFILCPAERQHNAFILFSNCLHLYLLIFWLWIHYLINQNRIVASFEHRKLFIRLNVSGKIEMMIEMISLNVTEWKWGSMM